MKNSGKYLLAIAGGMIAGGILALLFAPDKGSETRRKVAEKASKLRDKVKMEAEKYAESRNGAAKEEIDELMN